MKSPEDVPTLTCDNIVVAPRGIMEIQSGKILSTVPKSEIDRIILKFGRTNLHPVISMTVAILVLLVGVYGVFGLVTAPRGYIYELAMVVLGIIGGFMVVEALKKRFFLDVEEKKGFSRLEFSRHAQLKDIQEFCEQVRTVYKYKISDDLPPAVSSRPQLT